MIRLMSGLSFHPPAAILPPRSPVDGALARSLRVVPIPGELPVIPVDERAAEVRAIKMG
jgi:hypothetical protein